MTKIHVISIINKRKYIKINKTSKIKKVNNKKINRHASVHNHQTNTLDKNKQQYQNSQFNDLFQYPLKWIINLFISVQKPDIKKNRITPLPKNTPGYFANKCGALYAFNKLGQKWQSTISIVAITLKNDIVLFLLEVILFIIAPRKCRFII